MSINKYPPNNLIRLNAQYYDINQQLVDPTTAVLWVGGPDGIINQYNPVRDGIGLFHYDFLTSTPGGQWYYHYQGSFGKGVEVQSADTPFIVQFPRF